MALSQDAQRRLDTLLAGQGGAVVSSWIEDLLDTTKTALVSAPIDNVQKLQGKAAAYTELLRDINKRKGE